MITDADIDEVERRLTEAFRVFARLPDRERAWLRAAERNSMPTPIPDWWEAYGHGAPKWNRTIPSAREIQEADEVLAWMPLLSYDAIRSYTIANNRPGSLYVAGDDRMAGSFVSVPNDAATIVVKRSLGRSCNQIMGSRSKLSYGKGGNSRTQITRVYRACLRYLAERVMGAEIEYRRAA